MRDLIDLVERARSGDREALERLLERLERVFRRFIRGRIKDSNDVDDLVQNSLIRVQKSISDVRDPNSFESFALAAARYEMQDYFRGRYRIREILLDVIPEDMRVSHEIDNASVLDVDRALDRLSDHARTILEMREAGFRYQEIAREMDTTEAAVKMQVKRSFETLREWLGPEDSGE